LNPLRLHLLVPTILGFLAASNTPSESAKTENVLTIDVDSTQRSDIPPFGHQIDYLTFGGIYREVALRALAASTLYLPARSNKCVGRPLVSGA